MADEGKRIEITEGAILAQMQKVLIIDIEKGAPNPKMQQVPAPGERGATVPSLQPAPSTPQEAPASPPPASNTDSSSNSSGSESSDKK